jgi:hypothetical protein
MPDLSFLCDELLTKEQLQKIIPYHNIQIDRLVKAGKLPPPIVYRRQHLWRASTVRELGLLNEPIDPIVVKSRMEVMRLLFLQYGIDPAAADSWPRLAVSLASVHVLPFLFSVELQAKKHYAKNLARAVQEICVSLGADADV